MSILGNIYWKKNQKIDLRIDEVAGSDYSIIKIDNYKDFKANKKGYPDICRLPDEYFTAYIPTSIAYDLAELLFTHSKHRENGGHNKDYLSLFYDGKIDECEYITQMEMSKKEKKDYEKLRKEMYEKDILSATKIKLQGIKERFEAQEKLIKYAKELILKREKVLRK